MRRCIICHVSFRTAMSFRMLMDPGEEKMCEQCYEKLEAIEGSGCQRCGSKVVHEKQEICYDCVRWSKMLEGDVLERNYSLFYYNDFLKGILADYKYRGDVALHECFVAVMRRAYRKTFAHCIPVAIPLSPERLKERGFNQATLLARNWAGRVTWLQRATNDSGKQSKKTRRQRIALIKENPFKLASDVEPAYFSGKSVVIMDDIYTTGTTVRQAARVLIKYGAQSVSSLTIARS
ncbi:ComF family protein [Bacillus sp. FSL W7-1360]